jgi:hypothetical protein
MARNSTTTASSTKPSRKFGVNTSNIPDAAPTIPDGIYQGHLKMVKADAKDSMGKWHEVEDLQLFDVLEVIEGKKGARVHTGRHVLQGGITYAVELANGPDQELPMDTMTIFNGRVNIFFAKDEEGNWGLDTSANDYGVVNKTWKQFQTATGLTDDDINEILEATPFDEDEVIEVPERLQGVEGVEDMLQACKFYKTFFTLVAERVTGKEVKVKVARVSRGDSDNLVNEIDCGNFHSSCGLLAVEA